MPQMCSISERSRNLGDLANLETLGFRRSSPMPYTSRFRVQLYRNKSFPYPADIFLCIEDLNIDRLDVTSPAVQKCTNLLDVVLLVILKQNDKVEFLNYQLLQIQQSCFYRQT